MQTKSFYEFNRKQSVTTIVPKHGIIAGKTGRVHARRGSDDSPHLPQYLVKFDGKSNLCHFEQVELVATQT